MMASFRPRWMTGLIALSLIGGAAVNAAADEGPDSPYAGKPADPELCNILDQPELRSRMDGLLFKLLIMCDRTDELGQVRQEPAMEAGPPSAEAGGADVPVNDPSGDVPGSSHTQSETSMAVNEVTGTICSGYNDSWHHFSTNNGFSGFSRSTDGGATFTDRGALGANNFGDPSVVWRRSDGHFYYAALHPSGLGIWRSTDDCATFSFLGMIHSGGFDDKELMAVDNNPASPYYGRLYVVWTDFNAGGVIRSTHSDNGTSWSSPVTISGGSVQGAWPVIAPNGDVYVAWVQFGSGITQVIKRSTNGGVSYSQVTSPAANKPEPRDAAASGNCGRSALRGNIRYLPSPQIVVGPDGVVHVAYSYDPDGAGTGDVVDVFYRRSVDNGSTWGPELRLNDDATTNDQFYPTLTVGASNIVSATWYDRREDPGNLLYKYYQRMSFDGGVTWRPSEAVSDVASPVYLDPNLATCYHGDYDTHAQTETHAVAQWADDRNLQSGHNDPDVYADLIAISTDFLLLPETTSLAVCAPDSAVVTIDVPQFSGFSEPVTLATGALPAGLAAGFVPNPVTPPGSTELTLSGTGGVAPGTYDVVVTGTSSPSSIVHDTELTLAVFNAGPGQADLVAPEDGALNQPLRPVFGWTEATQAASYTLEVDDDPDFASPAVVEVGIGDTTFTPSSDLMSNTVYYWRVTADNLCGVGSTSEVFEFATVALPGDCGLGTVAVRHFEDDFESGAPGWVTGGTGSTWTLSGAQVHGGLLSYHATDVPTVSDQRLESPEVVLPTETPMTLQFWNWQTIESSSGGCYDGGIVEITTDGGSIWTQLENDVMAADNLYDGPISTGFGNPLGEREAWCGDPRPWARYVVSLDGYAGETVKFRFRLGTDSSVSREGWYVDDVWVQSCGDPTPDFSLDATPDSATICAGAQAEFEIEVGSISGFANSVTLTAAGNPGGTTTAFSTNPVTPPGASTLKIGSTAGAPGGSYTITVEGSADGSAGHDVDVTLELVAGTVAAPSLTAPPAGANGQPLRPTFQWTAVTGAEGYTLEVDDDPAFGSPEIFETGLAETTFTPAADLAEGTTYSWRVSSENLCGTGTPSLARSFTTRAPLPFVDGFESGDTSGWSSTGP